MNTLLEKITIQSFPTTSSHQTYLMEVEGRFFEIGKDTAELLEHFKRHGCAEADIDAFVHAQQGRYTKESVTAFLESLKKKLAPESASPDKRATFIYSRDLIPAEVLNKCSGVLKLLFHPWIMGVVVWLFLMLDGWHLIETYGEKSVQPQLDIYLLAALLCFFIFSSLFHETGHAAACRHFGIEHGCIGFGLYINIPVFYTDVSKAWTLPRGQRCIVNLGGVYFQMWLLLPFLITSLFIDSTLCDYIILMTNLNFLITLNPFFKFDGYWMMTDALGLANLRKRGTEWLAYIWARLRGKAIQTRPYLLSLSKGAKAALITYTVVVNMFFAFYFFYIIPKFLIRFYETFPGRFDTLMRELAYRQMPDWANLQQIVLQLLFLGLIVYMLYQSVAPLFSRKKSA